jgi:hypothetical protein
MKNKISKSSNKMKIYPDASARHYRRQHELHAEHARQAHRESVRWCGMENATEAIKAVRRRHNRELRCRWYDRAVRTTVYAHRWGKVEICMVNRIAGLSNEELEAIIREEVA